jgi:hypothetical protein
MQQANGGWFKKLEAELEKYLKDRFLLNPATTMYHTSKHQHIHCVLTNANNVPDIETLNRMNQQTCY